MTVIIWRSMTEPHRESKPLTCWYCQGYKLREKVPEIRHSCPRSKSNSPFHSRRSSHQGSRARQLPWAKTPLRQSRIASIVATSHPSNMICQPDRKSKVSTFHLPFVSQVCERKTSNPVTFLERFQSFLRSSSTKSRGDQRQSRPKFFKDSRRGMPRTISWSTASCSIFSMRLLPLIGFWSLWPASSFGFCSGISTMMSLTSWVDAFELGPIPSVSSASASLNWCSTTSFGTSTGSSWQQLEDVWPIFFQRPPAAVERLEPIKLPWGAWRFASVTASRWTQL